MTLVAMIGLAKMLPNSLVMVRGSTMVTWERRSYSSSNVFDQEDHTSILARDVQLNYCAIFKSSDGYVETFEPQAI